MAGIPTAATATMVLILPLPLLAAGLVGGRDADRHVRLLKKWVFGASWAALIGAMIATATDLLGSTASQTFLSIWLPAPWRRLALGVDLNAVTLMMLLLVGLVGLVVVRFSRTYLEGDRHEGRFHRWMGLTLGSFFMLLGSDNLWEFFLFWVVTSLFLHRLLAFYDRPGALVAARKHDLFDRVADAALFIALVVIASTLHTANISHIASSLADMPHQLPPALELASGLLVLSAVLKSALFPFHGWLIQVMEAPTPVSALLHAGIIYTGAFLLLRMVPLMARAAWAGDVLMMVGLISMTVASLMMMTASTIKGALAYSTAGQIGFVLMEFGLGLYGLVLLHIVSHAVYKAHSFLSSGSVVDQSRLMVSPPMPTSPTLGKALGTLVVSTAMVLLVASVFRVPWVRQPSLMVMGVVLTVAVSHLALQAINGSPHRLEDFLGVMMILSALVSIAYFVLDGLFSAFVGMASPLTHGLETVVYDTILGLIGFIMVGLLFLQQLLPRIQKTGVGQAIYVHLYNDLYVDLLFTRLVERLWSSAGAVSWVGRPNNRSSEERP